MKYLIAIWFVLSTAAGYCDSPAADTTILMRGVELLHSERFDEAREKLLESSSSNDPKIRAESFLYLNMLEMRLENYDEALIYLEQYHTQALKFYQDAADAQKERHRNFVGWAIGVAVIVFGGLSFFAWRWVRSRGEPSIQRFDISTWKRYKSGAAVFATTPVYAEIAELAAQPRDRSARVLSLARQDALERELAVVFAHFAARLQADYPELTAGDVKLCCLSLAGLSPYAQALCFGSTETNIIRQRKHKIKQRIDARLFEFIFSGGTA